MQENPNVERVRRPVKFVLDAELARRIDNAVAERLGGHSDRHELAAAALDSYLLDLEHTPWDTVRSATLGVVPEPPESTDLGQRLQEVIPRVQRGVPTLDRASDLRLEPMFGLHNRDWPSLWALSRLGQMAGSSPVDVGEFMAEVTDEAWELARRLGAQDQKLTALLPTNREKHQSAEDAFKAFAIAGIARKPKPNGKIGVSGPLPLWRAVAFTVDDDNQLLFGLTESGWDLLELAEGLTPNTPHDQNPASRFFDYLKKNAPEDWWGFQLVLTVVSRQPTRDELVRRFNDERSDWTESVAATTTQGYVARAREWGLVEPKLDSARRYVLTDFGKSVAGVGEE